MASGDKRIGTDGDSMPFGTEVISVGPLLQAAELTFPIYVPAGMGTIRVKKVRSVVNATIGTGDSNIEIRKASQAMTGGAFIIAAASSIEDLDSCTITNDEHARVPEETTIVIYIDGTTDGGEVTFFIEFERCQT